MKKITLEIFALLIFISLIFMILEFLFRDYRSAVDNVMDDFFEKKTGAEVLLVGNSHTLPMYHALKAQGNTGVACLTIGGDDLFWMQALVKRHLEEMPSTRYILLNCDDELLGFNQSLSGLKYMNRILYPYADTMYENSVIDKLLSRSNFFRSNRDLGFLFNKQAKEDMIMIGVGGQADFSDEDCSARAREISEKRFDKKLFPENLSYLKSIISEARKFKKEVFILKMPKCDCLQASVVMENLDASRRLLDSLFLAEKVEQLDFSLDTTFTRGDFANPDHLSVTAALKMMEMINEKLHSMHGMRPIQLGQEQAAGDALK